VTRRSASCSEYTDGRGCGESSTRRTMRARAACSPIPIRTVQSTATLEYTGGTGDVSKRCRRGGVWRNDGAIGATPRTRRAARTRSRPAPRRATRSDRARRDGDIVLCAAALRARATPTRRSPIISRAGVVTTALAAGARMADAPMAARAGTVSPSALDDTMTGESRSSLGEVTRA